MPNQRDFDLKRRMAREGGEKYVTLLVLLLVGCVSSSDETTQNQRWSALAERMTSSAKSFVAEGNPMAELSWKQFTNLLGFRKRSPAHRHVAYPYATFSDAVPPERIDWREHGIVSTVKDQRSCGSCWAFSAVDTTESAAALVDGELRTLSTQEVVDCDQSDYGCDGGEMVTAMDWIKDHGLDSESDYHYIGSDEGCNSNRERRAVVHIDSVAKLPDGDEEALKRAVSQQPVSVAVSAGHLSFMLYSSGILDNFDCSSDESELDHGVVVVGYDETSDGTQYWLVKNSWSDRWGESGYVRLLRNVSAPGGTCGIAHDMTVPLKTLHDPPEPPLTPDDNDDDDDDDESGDDDAVPCDLVRSCPSETPNCCCTQSLYGVCTKMDCCADDSNGNSMRACKNVEACCEDSKPHCDGEDNLCKASASSSSGTELKKRQPSFFSINGFSAYARM